MNENQCTRCSYRTSYSSEVRKHERIHELEDGVAKLPKLVVYLFFTLGSLLMMTSAIAFCYFVLFRYIATSEQYVAASLLFLTGVGFLTFAENRKRYL